MKTLILYKEDFGGTQDNQQSYFEKVLIDLDIPKSERKNIESITLEIDNFKTNSY